MTYTVPDSILEATDCPYTFSCLETGKCGRRTICEVDYAVPENILFLKSEVKEDCPYRWTFGAGRQVCKCPVHYFIFKNYVQ